MARRDYICCAKCSNKLIYDGYDCIRESLENTYGDKNGDDYTVKLYCPTCIDAIRADVLELCAVAESMPVQMCPDDVDLIKRLREALK